MKILGFDSSGLVASVALLDGDQIIAEYNANYKKTHSQTLLPMLDEITEMVNLDLTTVDALAVAAGPGSFTGLRIGSATVKGLGLALDIPVIPVPTMAGMAYNAYGYPGLICPIMDARRNQVFTGLYRFDGSELVTVAEQSARDMNELIGFLNETYEEMAVSNAAEDSLQADGGSNPCGDEQPPVLFLGDGVEVHRERIALGMKVPYTFAPAHLNRQRAASVATLGACLYAQGIFESAADHKPEYLRVSQAEREKAERLGKDANAQASADTPEDDGVVRVKL